MGSTSSTRRRHEHRQDGAAAHFGQVRLRVAVSGGGSHHLTTFLPKSCSEMCWAGVAISSLPAASVEFGCEGWLYRIHHFAAQPSFSPAVHVWVACLRQENLCFAHLAHAPLSVGEFSACCKVADKPRTGWCVTSVATAWVDRSSAARPPSSSSKRHTCGGFALKPALYTGTATRAD